MEQLIVVAVFAICAAVCVQIISVAHAMTTDATDTRRALIAAENAAESFKAFGGDTAQAAAFLSDGLAVTSTIGEAPYTHSHLYIMYFCENWQLTEWGAMLPYSIHEHNAAFSLIIDTHPPHTIDQPHPAVICATITVTRISDGERLVSLETAARPSRTTNAITTNASIPNATTEGATP